MFFKQRKKMFSIRFWLLDSESKRANQPCIVKCDISVNSVRTKTSFSTAIRVHRKFFDSDNQCIQDAAKNYELQQVKEKIDFIKKTFDSRNVPYNAEKIKAVYLGTQKLSPTFMEVAEELIKHKEDEKLSYNTIKSNKCRLKNIRKFLEESKQTYLACDEISQRVMMDLKKWLEKNLKACKQSHYRKHVQLAKQICDFSILREYTRYNLISQMRVSSGKQPKPNGLNNSELEILKKFKTDISDLQIAKDAFIFCCYTGLAHVDYESFDFDRDTYISIADGRRWLLKPRTKTTIEAQMPLEPEVLEILQRYHNKLPVLGTAKSSNQLHNRYIKVVFMLCKITKPVTTKTARQTACRRWIGLGYNENVICKLMGWTSTKQLSQYVEIDELMITEEMK